MLGYYKRVVWSAFGSSVRAFGLGHPVSLVLSVVSFTVAVLILRLFAGTAQVGEEVNWALAILGAGGIVFAVVFTLNLIAAPARMESEAASTYARTEAALQDEVRRTREAIAALHEQSAPRLAVSLDEPRLGPDGTRKFVRLRVDNEGHDQIVDCQGKLLNVKPLEATSAALPEPGQNLAWSSRGSDVPGVRRSIAAKSHEYLDVAFADDFLSEYGTGEVQVTAAIHARVQQLLDDPCRSSFYFAFLDWKAWRLPQGAYDVTIEVSAGNVGTPTPISFRLVYEGGLNLYGAS